MRGKALVQIRRKNQIIVHKHMFASSPHLNSCFSSPDKPHTFLHYVYGYLSATELNTLRLTGMITQSVESTCFNHDDVRLRRGRGEMMWSLMTTMTIFLNADPCVCLRFWAHYSMRCQDNVRLCERVVWLGNTLCYITGWVCVMRWVLLD